MKLLQQCFLIFIVVVIPGHNLGNSQVSVNRTIGPTLVFLFISEPSPSIFNRLYSSYLTLSIILFVILPVYFVIFQMIIVIYLISIYYRN